MAITNGFKPFRKPLDLEIRRITIANALATSGYTIGVGSALQPGATAHTRFATGATSSNPILGVVIGLIFQGKVSEVTSILGTNSAKGTSSAIANVYNDNETSGDWQLDYIPSYIPISYSATLSQAAGTTTDSAGLGYFNLTAISSSSNIGSGTLDETSIALYSGTQGQFWSFGTTTTTGTAISSCHVSKIL